MVNEAIKAQTKLEHFGIGSTLWCVTNYKRLREDSLEADREHFLYPKKKRKQSYFQKLMATINGPCIAVSDNMKLVSDQVAQWVPGGLLSLGTDGFGRSDIEKIYGHF